MRFEAGPGCLHGDSVTIELSGGDLVSHNQSGISYCIPHSFNRPARRFRIQLHVLQVTKSWAGPGNEATSTVLMHCTKDGHRTQSSTQIWFHCGESDDYVLYQ